MRGTDYTAFPGINFFSPTLWTCGKIRVHTELRGRNIRLKSFMVGQKENPMKYLSGILILAFSFNTATSKAAAADKEVERLKKAGEVITAVMGTPEKGIPSD